MCNVVVCAKYGRRRRLDNLDACVMGTFYGLLKTYKLATQRGNLILISITDIKAM